MADSLLLVALVSLLVGLTAGKAWERYKLQGGQWIDRRKLRGSPHYLQGLNFLVASPLDPAIEEFGRAAALNENSVDVHIVLGNLYREKGQVGRAIQIHQQLLQRPQLTRAEHTAILVCLGLDFKRGGFVDRAIEAFGEVLRLEPANQHALINLEKLHADQHQWAEAYTVRERLAALVPGEQRARHRTVLAFLENELGTQALARGDRAEALRRFEAAIELSPAVAPAYLNLGDLRARDGDATGAIATWERLIDVIPDRAHLALDRLREAYTRAGSAERFAALCGRLADANPQDWRTRLALARHLDGGGQPRAALDRLFEALMLNPHALMLHQAAWCALSHLRFDRDLVDRYVSVSREAVFYQDPHVCLHCHYRSAELLWQCPHCHEWNSFVEERLTPAKEDEELDPVGEV